MNTDLTYDGRIPADMREHMEPQLDINDLGIAFSKLAEALCIELNIACKRRYSHEELADSFRAIRQVNAERHESRTEEDKKEDDMDRQRAYPERRP